MASRAAALLRRYQLHKAAQIRRAMQHGARLALAARQSEAQRAEDEAAAARCARSDAEQDWGAALASRMPDPRLVHALASVVIDTSRRCDEAALALNEAEEQVDQARRAWSGALAAERACETAYGRARTLVKRVDEERSAIAREDAALRTVKARP